MNEFRNSAPKTKDKLKLQIFSNEPVYISRKPHLF